MVFQQVTGGVFVTPRNLTNLSVQVSVTALVALGVTWLLVARQIDLSSGALIALIAVMIAQSEVIHGWGFGVTVAVAIGIGLFSGLVNGVLVTAVGIPAFIATLGAFSYLRGAGYLISDGSTVSGLGSTMFTLGNGGLSPLPSVILIFVLAAAVLVYRGRRMIADVRRSGFRASQLLSLVAICLGAFLALWAFGLYQGIPYPVLLVLVAVAVASFVASQTRFGRHIYAVGGNPEAARRTGIKTKRILVVLFVVAGLLTSIGALIQAARLDAGPPSTAELMEMAAISAAVIGGTSLFGGRGTIGGTMLGAFLTGSIANGLSLAGVNTFWQLVATGLLLVAAVATDRRTRKEGLL
ncbi:sugar ABC transporter permease [Saccharopolyspora spinosa]|uniref:sugar ABC transporter permease n=1 Tax=Saccharopolyspora spinosa TaxID=60894 RepID=UPI003BACFF36